MIRLTPEIGAWLYNILAERGDRMDDPLYRGGTVAKLIKGQLDNPNHGSDLIEMVAASLSNPRSKGGIGSEQAEHLRRALLSPVELAEYRNKMVGNEFLNCAHCNKSLIPKEMCTFTNGKIYCSVCVMPSTMRHTHDCKHQVVITPALIKHINKLKKECKACASGETQAPPFDVHNTYYTTSCQYVWGYSEMVLRSFSNDNHMGLWKSLVDQEYLNPDGTPGEAYRHVRNSIMFGAPPTTAQMNEPMAIPAQRIRTFAEQLREAAQGRPGALPTNRPTVISTVGNPVGATGQWIQDEITTTANQFWGAPTPPALATVEYDDAVTLDGDDDQ